MLQTTSEVLSFEKKLEEDSAAFYEELSRKYPGKKMILSGFAAENRKFISQVQRSYYGVITDALEGCFAFEIDPENYTFTTNGESGEDWAGAVEKALEIEHRLLNFYSDAAEQSKSFMADVPRILTLIGRKRSGRKDKLLSLLNGRN